MQLAAWHTSSSHSCKWGGAAASHRVVATPHPALHANSHTRNGLATSKAPPHPAISAVRLIESLSSASTAVAAGTKQAPTTQHSTKTPNRNNEASVPKDSSPATHSSRGSHSVYTQLLGHLQRCLRTGREPSTSLCNEFLRGVCFQWLLLSTRHHTF